MPRGRVGVDRRTAPHDTEQAAPALAVVPDPPDGPVVPELEPGADSLSIALALADAGFYVLPTRDDPADPDAPKHAGSVVGKGWPGKSSRDPAVITSWFAGTAHRVAVHAGRSGLIVADVDHPEALTPELRTAIEQTRPPFQSTRPDEPGRGHYLFAQPVGRRIGNRAGDTGRAWGEWRGANGIVLVGGPGRRLEAGPVPVLPAEVANRLPDVGDGEAAVSNDEVWRFVEAHTVELSPGSLHAIAAAFDRAVQDGGSRHNAIVSALCWAVREVIAGRYSGRAALARLEGLFVAAMTVGRGPGDRVLSRDQAEAEFVSCVAWAVGQEWRSGAEAAPDPDAEEREDHAARLQDLHRAMRLTERTDDLRLTQDARDALAAERRPPLRPLDSIITWDDELESVPAPGWTVPGLIPDEAVGWLGGPSGSYKSFVAVSIACAIAYGMSALEDDDLTPERPLRVLYVAGEGPKGIALRLRALRERRAIGATRRLAEWKEAIDLTNEHAVARLKEYAVANEFGFLVVDTFRQSTPGVNENDNTEVGLILRTLLDLREEHGIGSLLLDHTAKNAKGLADLGGAGAKRANADYVLMVDLPNGDRGADQQRTLRVAKFKDAPDGETWPVRLAPVPEVRDTEGKPSAVVVVGEVDDAGSIHGEELWNDPLAWPLPADVLALTERGRGRAAIAHVAMYMRHMAADEHGVGVRRTEVVTALQRLQEPETRRPLYGGDNTVIRNAWSALVSSGRIRPTGSTRTGESYWEVLPDDPARR